MKEFGKNLTLSSIITNAAGRHNLLPDHRCSFDVLRLHHLHLLLLVHSKHQVLMLNYARVGEDAVQPHFLKNELYQLIPQGYLWIQQKFWNWCLQDYFYPNFERRRLFYGVDQSYPVDDILKLLARLVWVGLDLHDCLLQLVKSLVVQLFALSIHGAGVHRQRSQGRWNATETTNTLLTDCARARRVDQQGGNAMALGCLGRCFLVK